MISRADDRAAADNQAAGHTPDRRDDGSFIDLAQVRGTGAASTRLRADAERNRARVLAAAERLFASADPRQVTMQDIARAAGVGRATLYRRYPTPAAVALALLDEHERQLQEAIMRGRPPLGPGAAPADRLAAFYDAMVELLERHLHLALGAEAGGARLRTGAYRFWRLHVRTLVAGQLADPEAAVDQLLSPLAPEVYRFQRHELGLDRARIAAALRWLAHHVLGPPATDDPTARTGDGG